MASRAAASRLAQRLLDRLTFCTASGKPLARDRQSATDEETPRDLSLLLLLLLLPDPSTSGRELLAAASFSAKAHAFRTASSAPQLPWGSPSPSPSAPWPSMRPMSSLSKTGVPGPDPQASQALSQYYGGHGARRLALSLTVLQLDDALHRLRKVLTPTHLALAARMLLKISRNPSVPGSEHTLQFQRIAHQLEHLSAEQAPRLVAGQVASVVSSLSALRHVMVPGNVTRLAARLVADDCQRLRLASDQDLYRIVTGFAGQGYSNALFWERLSAAAAPRLHTLDAPQLCLLLQQLPPVAGDALAAAALRALPGRLPQLPPAAAVDLAQWVMKRVSGRGGGASKAAVPPELVSELISLAASPELLGRLSPKQVALLVSAAGKLAAGRRGPAADAVGAAVGAWAAGPGPEGLRLQHVAGIVQSVAGAGRGNAALFGRMAAHAQKLLEQQDPGSSSTPSGVLTNLAAAFRSPAALGAPGAEELLQRLDAELGRRGQEALTPQV